MSTVATIINIIAIIAAPIIAVWVGQKLQDRAASRKDKMAIFQCLMTQRAIGWAQPMTVNALNSIDIVFQKDKEVREKWATLLALYQRGGTNNMDTAQCALLEAMAKALGYEKNITWKEIQNPYLPKGLLQAMQDEAEWKAGQLAAAKIAKQFNQFPQPASVPVNGMSQKQDDTTSVNA